MEDQTRTLVLNIQKEMSDSGYGSNKSNSQYHQSSDSSKSRPSSHSSEGHEDIVLNHSYSNPTIQGRQISDQGQNPGPSGLQMSPSKGQQKYKGKSISISNADLHPPIHQHIRLRQPNKPILPTAKMDRRKNDPLFPRSLLKSSKRRRPRALDAKTLHMDALTRTLSRIKRFAEPAPDIKREISGPENSKQSKWQDHFEEHLTEKIGSPALEDGFATAVSIEDGSIVHLTSNITNVLGFSKDMWIGHNFIDFIHPEDRISFTSHMTSGLSFPIDDANVKCQGKSKAVNSEPFFCRMRQYRGLKSTGFGVVDKTILYVPFKLTMKLKEIDLEESQKEQEDINQGSGCLRDVPIVRLVILAMRMKSAFQYPEEVNTNPAKFITRHSASCKFDHFDADAINYLGYLPQDIIGHSILDYYHPEDMILLKSIYEGVMLEQGKPFKSKPYRFRAFNGTFVLMETDWSCFINPWSWKLEFVIGQHRVVKGPLNPNVFMTPKKGDLLLVNEEDTKKCKCIQDEIKKLLSETGSRRLFNRRQSLRRQKYVAAMTKSLLDPTMPNTGDSVKSGSQCSGSFSLMEKDTEMLGEISPYHDDSGSNESSERPPSYSQLNYRENIERFFLSQPKTARSEESAEKMEINRSSMDEDSKVFPDYSSGSNYGQGNGSNGSGDCESNDPFLTANLLSKHNDDMEKVMTQRYREHRVKSKPNNTSTPNQKDSRSKQSFPEQHGVKRGINPGWCGESREAIKLPHLEAKFSTRVATTSGHQTQPRSTTVWPPCSISPTPGLSTMTSTMASISSHQYLDTPSTTLGPALINPAVHIMSPLVLLSQQNQPQFLKRAVPNFVPQGFASFYPTSQSLLTCSQPNEKLLSGMRQTPSVYPGPYRCVMSVKETPSRLRQSTSSCHFQTVASIIDRKTKEKNLLQDLDDSCSSSMYSLLKSNTSEGSTSLSFDSQNNYSTEDKDENDYSNRSRRSRAKNFKNRSEKEDRDSSLEDDVFVLSLNQLQISPEIIFRFQIPIIDSTEVLLKDLKALKFLGNQSMVVNEQLNQLYSEIQSDNRYPLDMLEDGTTSSSESEYSSSNRKTEKKSNRIQEKTKSDCNKMITVFEKNARFPPPLQV